MTLRRWLLAGAVLCALIGAGTLTLALCCLIEIIGGQCELWLLGPFVALPLGLGLGLIGRALARPGELEAVGPDESHGCGDCEET